MNKLISQLTTVARQVGVLYIAPMSKHCMGAQKACVYRYLDLGNDIRIQMYTDVFKHMHDP